MSSEKQLSVPHTGCRYNQCIIKFNTPEMRQSVKTPRSETGKEVMDKVVKSLVYLHGYEKAHEMINQCLEQLKYNWQE